MKNPLLGNFKMDWKPGEDIPHQWLRVVSNFVMNFSVHGAGTLFTFDGVRPNLTAGGGGVSICGYRVRIKSNQPSADTVTIDYGTLTGEVFTGTGHTTFAGVPTIGGTEIGSDPAPELTLVNNATNVILLKVTTDPYQLIKTAVFVASDSTSLPTNTKADPVGDTAGPIDGIYYLEVGRVTMTSGVATNARNDWCGGVQFHGCGDGNAQWSILGNQLNETLVESGA